MEEKPADTTKVEETEEEDLRLKYNPSPEEKLLNDYRLLGNSGLRVSPLCLGAMNFGSKWASYLGDQSVEETIKIFDLYASKGGNFIDTAINYQEGESELRLGELLNSRGINRDDFVIATKYSGGFSSDFGKVNNNGNNRKNLLRSLDISLKTLQTDYIDLYYIHFWDYTTPIKELLRTMDDVVRSGKVRYVAISDTPAWVVSRANTIADFHGWPEFIGYQGRYHLGDRTIEADVVPMCNELNIGIVPWGVLGQGKFTGKYKRGEAPTDAKRGSVVMTEKDYDIAEEVANIAKEIGKTPAQVTLNWVYQQPLVTSSLIGARTEAQLEDSLQALSFNLSAEHIARLNAVSKPELVFPHNMLNGTKLGDVVWIKKGGRVSRVKRMV